VNAPKLFDPVYAERVRATYSQLPLTLAVTATNSALVAVVLKPFAPAPFMWGWLAAVLALACARLTIWAYYKRSATSQAEAPTWGFRATAGALLSGVLWGFGAAFLFPPADDARLLLAIVIAGMCAGAATVHAAHTPSVIAFILPATLPLSARFVATGNPPDVVAGIMVLIFGIALCAASRKFEGWFTDTVSAHLELAQRTDELDQANAQLASEMSSRIATEQKLLEAQKLEAVGRLTAGVAHDFNNILMVVSGLAEKIARQLGSRSGQAADLETMMQATRRGANLTRQLLAFGRRQALQPLHMDLNHVVDRMRSSLQAVVPGSVAIDLQLAPQLDPVLVDPQQIEQALLELVVNARDAMPDGGHVTITTRNIDVVEADAAVSLASGHYVELAVADTGSGMQEATLTRAFEPFFTTKEVGRGAGLGLSHIHGLAHQLGGTATIESSPDLGTTVHIILPGIR
jgi:signal transduction histidine kinase